MRDDLTTLQAESDRIGELGKALFRESGGNIFPCDALALSVLGRSLNLIRGFTVLIEAGSYACAVPLLRLQLDSMLRFYGVVSCQDPHEVARQVLSGVSLRKIKHSSSGEPMTDQYLQRLLESRFPWLPSIYSLSSAYIHLSEEHFLHVLMQAPKDATGKRQFAVSDQDDYLPEEHKGGLIESFTTVTQCVWSVVDGWLSVRQAVTQPTELVKTLAVI